VFDTAICRQLVYVQLRVMSLWYMLTVPWFLWNWTHNPTLFLFNCKDKTSCHYSYTLRVVDWPSWLIYAWLCGVQLTVMSDLMQCFLLIECWIVKSVYSQCMTHMNREDEYTIQQLLAPHVFAWHCQLSPVSFCTTQSHVSKTLDNCSMISVKIEWLLNVILF